MKSQVRAASSEFSYPALPPFFSTTAQKRRPKEKRNSSARKCSSNNFSSLKGGLPPFFPSPLPSFLPRLWSPSNFLSLPREIKSEAVESRLLLLLLLRRCFGFWRLPPTLSRRPRRQRLRRRRRSLLLFVFPPFLKGLGKTKRGIWRKKEAGKQMVPFANEQNVLHCETQKKGKERVERK